MDEDRLLESLMRDFPNSPEQAHLAALFEAFQERLRQAGLTPEALLADLEAHKEETFQKLYPGLAEE